MMIYISTLVEQTRHMVANPVDKRLKKRQHQRVTLENDKLLPR